MKKILAILVICATMTACSKLEVDVEVQKKTAPCVNQSF